MTEMTFALLAFLLPLAYSPGPGNLFFAASGARFGLRAALPALWGYHGATLAVTLALGLCFGAAMAAAPALTGAMQVAGAVYVLWLAFRLLNASGPASSADAHSASAYEGALLLVLNPKAYVIIALMFTQFIGAAHDTFLLVLWITAVFTLNNLVAFLAWTILGDRLARLFRGGGCAQALNAGFAVLLAGVAVWMLIG